MRFSIVLVTVFLGVALAEEPFRYDGYKVYQVTPTTVDEANLLNEYQENPAFDFWSQPRALNNPVTVMVTPYAQVDFEKRLALNSLNFTVLIEDVEGTVVQENLRQSLSRATPRGEVSFTQFMRYDAIVDYLQTLAQNYPSLVRLLVLGQTYEGRDIVGVRISTGGFGKPEIFIDAGIHAREWIAPPTALYIIQQLVENSANSALLTNVDWVVIPSLNPDGYEYTHTNTRLWRKTRSPNVVCDGVDPNRNFDFYWMLIGASNDQCSEVFAGPTPFSESETRALRDYLLEHQSQIKLYLTYHSYGRYLLYPWGYTSALPNNNNELHALAVSVNEAIRSVSGTTYAIGTSTNVLYAAAGGSDDYAKGVAGIELSYTIELPGGGTDGFNPPATRIIPVVEESWEGVKAYHAYIESTYTRLWRKTRSPNTLCYGVDPNRNFDFYWMLTGASSDQCSEIFAGRTPFSESEARALRDYLLANQNSVKLYISFHSYGQYLLYPWGYTTALPPNNNELFLLAFSVNNAIRAVSGTTYSIGTSTNVLYAAAGGSDDYAKGVAGIELSYTIELPGGGNTGFNPAASSILPIVRETWEGIKVYHDYIERQFG